MFGEGWSNTTYEKYSIGGKTLLLLNFQASLHIKRPTRLEHPRWFNARLRYRICGKNFNLTKRSITPYVMARELPFRGLDSSSPTPPRNLGEHRRFGSILPMHSRGGQSCRRAGVDSQS
jgi:hypothetical protein